MSEINFPTRTNPDRKQTGFAAAVRNIIEEMDMSIATFDNDPPDSSFQADYMRGYLRVRELCENLLEAKELPATA